MSSLRRGPAAVLVARCCGSIWAGAAGLTSLSKPVKNHCGGDMRRRKHGETATGTLEDREMSSLRRGPAAVLVARCCGSIWAGASGLTSLEDREMASLVENSVILHLQHCLEEKTYKKLCPDEHDQLHSTSNGHPEHSHNSHTRVKFRVFSSRQCCRCKITQNQDKSISS